MDYTNTEAVWAMLTAPITVIDGNFRAQAKVYAEPAKDSQVTRVIACTLQVSKTSYVPSSIGMLYTRHHL